ncbi:nifU-like protein 4, mitochondrial [Magnolia sinica]|uniref:nifU-like protein 4, mitochondrial n=1 Tax=Magnolia sinica TaxID=86752 RepID=UPI0026588FFE|nr:nifU-like protein 4, mitochondrial [Magnolia sinica]
MKKLQNKLLQRDLETMMTKKGIWGIARRALLLARQASEADNSSSRRFFFSPSLYQLTNGAPFAAAAASNPLRQSPLSPFNSNICGSFGGQKRSMFIQTQSTPNPASLMFYPGKPVMDVGSADFPNARAAMGSPLAKSLYAIDGITRVFFGSDFITVTKSDEASWDFLKPEIFAAIMDFYSSGKPLFLDSNVAASMDTAIHEDDSEIVAMIKELLETRIRPAVQDDGGDIEYRGFDPETGIVKLRMQGACSGCPSSSVTLKSGIENMLMHYVSENILDHTHVCIHHMWHSG